MSMLAVVNNPDINSFDEGYLQSELQDAQPVRKPVANIDGLGVQLMTEFHDAEQAREMVNLRWLDDLRQYRGIYDEKVNSCLCNRKTSRAFYRLTTAKVNTMSARLMDLLFPQKTINWEISPTPDPMLPDEILAKDLAPEIAQATEALVQAKIQELTMQGVALNEIMLQQLTAECSQQAFLQVKTPENIKRVANDRAKAMSDVIEDQLQECNANGQTRPSWRQNCARVIKSACMYGMGVLKGPLIEQVETKQFMPQINEDGSTTWQEQTYATELRPYHEAVSVWEIYPDPGACIPAELRYVWQRHTKTDKELRELLNVPGFDADKINDYMRQHEDGDAEQAQWEAQVRELNADNISQGSLRLKKRFVLYERWGYLSGKELAEAGLEIDEQAITEIFPSCIWILGNTIIKASVNPLEGVDIPYHFFPYQEDESSFWPEGICYQLRTPQSCINSAVRAMQDNSGLTSGPITGVNLAMLSVEESLEDMRAGKIFLFDDPNVKLQDAFQAVTVPSAIEQNLNLVNFWSEVADEVSTPRFNQGDGRVAGAGETASGLSMLMGASNVLLKDHVKDFDDHIVTPFIRAMFKWNMKWNMREDIKGDFEVVASGSQSLVAKEVRAQQIPAILNFLANPLLATHINERKLLEVALEQTDLPSERILRTEEEAAQHQQEQLQMQAQAQVEALMAQLQKTGMTPEQIQQQLMLILAQTVAQGNQPNQAQMPDVSSQSLPQVGTEIPTTPPQPLAPQNRQLPIKGAVNV